MNRFPKILVAAVALLASPAFAATTSPTSTTFTVSATVAKACTVAATNLSLGTYDPSITTDLAPATGSNIAVTCTKNTNITVAALTTSNGFKMHSATGGDLTYKLYQDVAHTKDWSTTNATGTSASSKTAVNFGVFGVVPNNQDVGAANDYTDTVTVSVTFN
jgi:spore coat protein U-like protein